MRIFCDGSCAPNPGPGGWAAIGVSDEDSCIWTVHGRESYTTNNRMELTALIAALERCKPGDVVYTDSSLCRNTVCVWAQRWEALDWRKPDGQTPSNLDLVKRAYALKDRATILWVKAHAGNRWNEEVDRLANVARTGIDSRTSSSVLVKRTRFDPGTNVQ